MAALNKKYHFNSTNVRMVGVRQWAMRLILGTLWRWTPMVAQTMVNRLFFSPKRPPLSKAQKIILSQAKAYEWGLGGKTIKYWCWGQGPTVLLAHGWNGRGVSFSRFIEPLIDNGYQVIAFDAPAHGESEGKTTSYFEFTNVMRAFIHPDQGLNIVGIIGHSFGGAATVNALSKERLSIPAVLIAPALKLKEVLDNTFNHYGIPVPICRHIISEYEKKYGYHLESDNPVRLLPTVTGPMLVMHDRDDTVISYEDSDSAMKENPTIRFHTTAGLGHKRILLNEEIVNMTLAFIGENQPGHPVPGRHMPDRHIADSFDNVPVRDPIDQGGNDHEKSIPHH